MARTESNELDALLQDLDDTEVLALWGTATAMVRQADDRLTRTLRLPVTAATVAGLIAQHRGWDLVLDAAHREARRRRLPGT